MDARLDRLGNARKFISAWGIAEDSSGDAMDFLSKDPVLHYASTTVAI